MEFLRYLIVFLVVGWGGGLIGGLLFLLTMPLLSGLRGTTAGRLVGAAKNGASTLAAVVLAFHACKLTGTPPSYAMFAIAFAALLMNDVWRIKRAHQTESLARQDIASLTVSREGIVSAERMNMVADLIGFPLGMSILPTLSII